MKFLLPIFFIAIFLYLNRTYAYYFDYIGEHYQTAPAQTILREEDEKPGFVALGDSLMAGVGAGSGGESLGLLLYKAKGENEDLEFQNLAVAGATAKVTLKEQLPQALQSRPQTAFLLTGINDVHNFTSEQEFEKNYREIVNGLTQTGSQLTLINIPYLGSNSILLPPWNLYMDFKTKQLNTVIGKIAKEKNLKVVDLYKLSREKFIEPSSLYSEDQFHPTDKGYALWSEYINAN